MFSRRRSDVETFAPKAECRDVFVGLSLAEGVEGFDCVAFSVAQTVERCRKARDAVNADIAVLNTMEYTAAGLIASRRLMLEGIVASDG